jgi:hypothetical protein
MSGQFRAHISRLTLHVQPQDVVVLNAGARTGSAFSVIVTVSSDHTHRRPVFFKDGQFMSTSNQISPAIY